MISGWMPRSAGRPVHRPAAEDVRVDVTYCLAGPGASVKDNPVAVGGNALGDRHLMRAGDEVGQQPWFGGGELGQARVMFARNHKYVNGCLRVDIAERQSSLIG